MRRFDEAEAVLKRGLEAEPTSVELSLDLGGFYIVRADARNAKIAFARALANSPRNPRALHGSGFAHLFEGEIERAAERFRQVLAIQAGRPARAARPRALSAAARPFRRRHRRPARDGPRRAATLRQGAESFGVRRPRSILDSPQRRRPIPQSRRVKASLPERLPR